MKKIVLFFLLPILFYGQKRDLGKVTVEELMEKRCPIDTSAPAAILFSIGKVSLNYSESSGFVMRTNVKTKIKIYKKEGYDWANKTVSYYIGGSVKEKLYFSNAATYNIENGKIIKSKLKSEGEFDTNINKFWAQKKIALPNVKEGSIVEYEYELVSENLGSIDEWEFQSSIPVVYSQFTTFTPEYYMYKPIMRGYVQPKITELKNNRSIVITSKERDGSYVSKTTFTTDKIDYTENQMDLIAENLPAMNDEAYVNNIKNYLSSIVFELVSIQFPNQPYKNFATDWETVAKKIYENEDFGAELNKNGYYESDMATIIKDALTPQDKMMAVFSFVKNRMSWNDFTSYSCDVGVKKAYNDRVGNVAEINLMLTSMLRHIGLEANPVILSTRSNRIALFPSRTAFNYVICGVEMNGEIILLDATDKYSLPNVLPIRDLNWFGRLIRKDGTSSSIDLNPKILSKEVVNLMATILPDGNVEGKVRSQYFDHNAYTFRYRYNSISNESMVEQKEKRYPGVEFSEYEAVNKNDLSKPIIENYTFTSNNSCEVIGDKIYFSPFLHLALQTNPFHQEKREYPIDFVFPQHEKYNINITIPDGYVVETLPETKAFSLPDNKGLIRYNISSTNNVIQLLFIFELKESLYAPEEYENIKLFFKELITKHSEKIVLKKT